MSMLHRAKMICSSDLRFMLAGVNKLRSLFLANNDTNNFFNKILKQFLDSFSCATTNCNDDTDNHFFKVPYRGGVEDTRLEAKNTKKIRGQGQGQPFRGQTFSRPKTRMLEAKAKGQGHRR